MNIIHKVLSVKVSTEQETVLSESDELSDIHDKDDHPTEPESTFAFDMNESGDGKNNYVNVYLRLLQYYATIEFTLIKTRSYFDKTGIIITKGHLMSLFDSAMDYISERHANIVKGTFLDKIDISYSKKEVRYRFESMVDENLRKANK